MEVDVAQARLAVLIDADNASTRSIADVLVEIARFGVPTVRRAYGDWTVETLRPWKEALVEHSIQPIQQFAYTSGKNATDSALIIDAMDLLHAGHLDGFCIVSSDSDFTRLASRIREQGMRAYGFGERKTPRSFVSACDAFIYVENLRPPGDTPSIPAEIAVTRNAELTKLLTEAVVSCAGDDGWSDLAAVGQKLRVVKSDFDPRNYGFLKLKDLVNAHEGFEVGIRAATASRGQATRVRTKATPSRAGAAQPR